MAAINPANGWFRWRANIGHRNSWVLQLCGSVLGVFDSSPKRLLHLTLVANFILQGSYAARIIGIAGESVQVLPMKRPDASKRGIPRELVLGLAVLVAPGFLIAQATRQADASAPPATSQTVVGEWATSDARVQSDQTATGELRTAGEIDAEGVRAADPADIPPVAAPAAKSMASLMAPPAVPYAQSPQQPAKYDVTLIGHRNIGTGMNFYSIEREIALGHDLSRQVEESSKLVSDPAVVEYINRIGQNLVRNSDSRVPFTIKVVDSSEVNAFALPGGFFYVDSGLILAADTEAELAAVMAHEIAHVAARHATKNMTKQQIWNMASIPLMFIGGPAGYAIAEVASLAVPMGFLKFSRDAEREADMLGLQYDYAAGYDPQAFVQFFEKLKVEENKKHSNIAKLFSTHPMNADRIAAAQAEIRTYLPDRESYVVDTSEFEAMKARLIGLEGGLKIATGQSANRPVLRKPAQAAETGDSPAASPKSGTKDDAGGPPTLKRTPASSD
jgi:Zn-dependent protease with chaperone function